MTGHRLDTDALHCGDSLAWLAALPDASVDAVVTDPPYSSGGMMRGDRAGASTREKYTDAKRENTYPEFSGDNRDQRSWAYWMALWLGEALRATRPGGVVAMFTDWRQLPAACDSLQAGGWIERGIVPWIKPDSRPQLGRFTQNAEFVVWGSNGPMPVEGECLPGYYLARTPRASEGRVHITQKPLDVMRSIVRIAPPRRAGNRPVRGVGHHGCRVYPRGARVRGLRDERRGARDRASAPASGPGAGDSRGRWRPDGDRPGGGLVSYLPDRVYRGDRQRESVWEALDAMPEGGEFTLDGLWRTRGVGAHYTMVAAVVRDAVALGVVERLGRLPARGGPLLLRKRAATRPDRSGESMGPPVGWRRPRAGAR